MMLLFPMWTREPGVSSHIRTGISLRRTCTDLSIETADRSRRRKETQMASSSSQSSSTQYPMSFPLHKLSFCTTPVLASKMTWTHLPAQDSMFTVYDKVRKAGLGGAIMEKHVLKVIRGADVLVCWQIIYLICISPAS